MTRVVKLHWIDLQSSIMSILRACVEATKRESKECTFNILTGEGEGLRDVEFRGEFLHLTYQADTHAHMDIGVLGNYRQHLGKSLHSINLQGRNVIHISNFPHISNLTYLFHDRDRVPHPGSTTEFLDTSARGVWE